jgi:hypothetical protein
MSLQSCFHPLLRNVTENLVGPQVVGIPLAGYDPDFKQSLSFEIVGGNGSSIFEIDPCSGQISSFLASQYRL